MLVAVELDISSSSSSSVVVEVEDEVAEEAGVERLVIIRELLEPTGLVEPMELVAVKVTLLGCVSVPEGEDCAREKADDAEVDRTID